MNKHQQIQYVEQDAERMICRAEMKHARAAIRSWWILYLLYVPVLFTLVCVLSAPALVLLLPFGGVFLALIKKAKERYRKAFKQVYVQQALESLLSAVTYEPKGHISAQIIDGTKIFPGRYQYGSGGEDYISAQYKTVGFAQSDVHIEYALEHTHMGTNQSPINVFKGRWMIFQFNKRFSSRLMVVQKGFHNTKTKLAFEFDASLFEPVELESASFNSTFRVYAGKQHEAFYLLTPPLMEQMQKLADCCKGNLLFCFEQNRLHILIQTRKNAFEPVGAFKSLGDEAICQKLREEIEGITQFIDVLSLDNDLFVQED